MSSDGDVRPFGSSASCHFIHGGEPTGAWRLGLSLESGEVLSLAFPCRRFKKVIYDFTKTDYEVVKIISDMT